MIKSNSVVGMTYILTDHAGKELDRAEKKEPFYYLHGFENIVPGLERALEGLKPGDKKTVKLEAADAYGDEDPNLYIKVPMTAFPNQAKVSVGQMFQVNDPDGHPRGFTVQAIVGDKVHLNGNHPLAGQKLNFEVEIMTVREATPEELAHGHVHGPGGAHH
jgi:FKBP-type peptidyl-prolyl cis-trans isomerase SlyD